MRILTVFQGLVASGTVAAITFRDLVEEACKVGGISTKCVISSKGNLRPLDVENLTGDFTKAKKKLGWKPNTKFKKLIKIMVEEDISRWSRWQKKEYFPWDAFTAGEDSAFSLKS